MGVTDRLQQGLYRSSCTKTMAVSGFTKEHLPLPCIVRCEVTLSFLHCLSDISLEQGMEAEFIKQATEAWEEAIKIAESTTGWKEEKNDKKTGDIVESSKNEKGKKIYRCKATVAAPPALLIEAMRDTDKVVDCAKTGFKGDVFVMGGRSVDYKDAPPSSKIVRAINGPGCQMIAPVADDPNSSTFIWLMDCDNKGWMPQSVLDIAMPIAQTQFIECLKKLAQKLKEEGKF